jgi:hypothetical protein
LFLMTDSSLPIPVPVDQDREGNKEASTLAAGGPVTFVKRGARVNRSNIRKRDDVGGGSGSAQGVCSTEDDAAPAERRAKRAFGEPLAFSTKEGTGGEETGAQVTYTSNRVLPTGRDETVFKMLQTETEVDRDAR